MDELVSVENPESCTTLPLLFSPLLGSFLPLCELLRLRDNEEEDSFGTVAPPIADEADVEEASFLERLLLPRIPGCHSLLKNKIN